MKKIICLFISIFLLFSLSIPAYAAYADEPTLPFTSFNIKDYPASSVRQSVANFLLTVSDSEGTFVTNSTEDDATVIWFASKYHNEDIAIDTSNMSVVSTTGSNDSLTCGSRDCKFIYDESTGNIDLFLNHLCYWSTVPEENVLILATNFDIPTVDGNYITPEMIQPDVSTTDPTDSDLSGILGILNDIKNFFLNIGDFIVSLIVPEPGYVDDWVSGVVDDFKSRSGLLTYPLALLVKFVDSVTNLSGQEPVLTTTNLVWQEVTIIPAMSYNFNDLLKVDAFNTIYQIYLIIIKAVFAFCLVRFAKRKFDELIGGDSNAS